MQKNETYKLYGFAGAAFLFALLKYFFVGTAVLTPKFFVFEIVSFGLFLAIIYLFDRFIRATNKNNEAVYRQNKNIKEEGEQEIDRLQKIIAQLKGQEQEEDSDEAEIIGLTQQIIDGLKDMADSKQLAKRLLDNMAKVSEMGLGVCYFYHKPSERFTVKATYGLASNSCPKDFVAGQGLNGQTVADKQCRAIADIPEDYFDIESGSGKSKPNNMYLLPIVKGNNCIGLIEMASFAQTNVARHWSQLNQKIVEILEF